MDDPCPPSWLFITESVLSAVPLPGHSSGESPTHPTYVSLLCMSGELP